VTFRNDSPWPVAAAGFGFSIVPRGSPAATNSNNGADWRASAEPGGSPGRDDPSDPNLDWDGDGMLDWQEYVAGTDPTDRNSVLKIDSVALAGTNDVILTFRAIANKTYTVEYTDALAGGTWPRLADVAAQPSNREETVRDKGFLPHRFYRLRTPAKP
jgi:hypothetical protein